MAERQGVIIRIPETEQQMRALRNQAWVRGKVAERGWTKELEQYATSLVNYSFSLEAQTWLSRSSGVAHAR